MAKNFRSPILGFFMLTPLLVAMANPESETEKKIFQEPQSAENKKNKGTEIAVLAGGCFWGMEGLYESLKGVKSVVSGYSGGSEGTATYRQVGSGKTGHAESIKIEYDPSVISFEELLKIFFSVAHDPTQLNYQGPDKGSQYRSAIFYTGEEQKNIAEEYIKVLDKEKVFSKSIVTEVSPLKGFYPAEDYHQNFMRLNPDYPYIVCWDSPKLDRLKEIFPDLLADEE